MPVPASLAIVACLAAALWAPQGAAQSITDLGFFLPAAINASGQMAGSNFAILYGFTEAYLYSGGVVSDLGTMGRATGINASGEIVGFSPLPDGTGGFAFLISPLFMTSLGALPGGSESWAYGINDSGQVVGYSTLAGAPLHAFLYSSGTMTDLGTLSGDALSAAEAINDSGQIVGFSGSADLTVQHAFLYSGGVMTALSTLPGEQNSIALGINASGQVVGSLITASGDTHAFLYSNGVMTDLGTLSGSHSVAYGINASGQVAGSLITASGANHAFLYSNGVMLDLNSLLPANSGWVLQEASAINDSGQIAGQGISPVGKTDGFRLDLTSLSPGSATAGAAAFTLTVTGIGTNFIPGATVNWNGTVLAASYVSATQMTASVPASLIATAGSASVTVTTDAGTLAGGTFTIHPARALPGVPERPRGALPRAEQ